MNAIEIARDLRAQAATLIEAADILDPPKPKRRNGRRKLNRTFSDEKVESMQRATTIHMGTAGRTSHPDDPDAKALAESLAYTTEEPK